jgi:hypothetical protein
MIDLPWLDLPPWVASIRRVLCALRWLSWWFESACSWLQWCASCLVWPARRQCVCVCGCVCAACSLSLFNGRELAAGPCSAGQQEGEPPPPSSQAPTGSTGAHINIDWSQSITPIGGDDDDNQEEDVAAWWVLLGKFNGRTTHARFFESLSRRRHVRAIEISDRAQNPTTARRRPRSQTRGGCVSWMREIGGLAARGLLLSAPAPPGGWWRGNQLSRG